MTGLPPPTPSLFTGRWTLHPSRVYLAMNTISVVRNYFTPEIYSNKILTLHPSQLSSQVYKCTSASLPAKRANCDRIARPFNFADLKGPIPASVYFAEDRVGRYNPRSMLPEEALFNGRLHDTIIEGNYWPTLSLPTDITSINPGLFESCSPFFHYPTGAHPGIWDPPVSLTPIPATGLPEPSIVSWAKSDYATPTIVFVPESDYSGPGQSGEQKNRNTPHSSNISSTITTITSRSTLTTLPKSILELIGSQTVQVGGPALTIGNVVISRTPDGNFIIESSQVYSSATTTEAKPGTNIQMSGEISTTVIAARWLYICVFSVFGIVLLL
jgi:hypothetical protein